MRDILQSPFVQVKVPIVITILVGMWHDNKRFDELIRRFDDLIRSLLPNRRMTSAANATFRDLRE